MSPSDDVVRSACGPSILNDVRPLPQSLRSLSLYRLRRNVGLTKLNERVIKIDSWDASQVRRFFSNRVAIQPAFPVFFLARAAKPAFPFLSAVAAGSSN